MNLSPNHTGTLRRKALGAVVLTQGTCGALQVLTCIALPLLLSPKDVGLYIVLLTLVHLMVSVGTLGVQPLLEGSYGIALRSGTGGRLLHWALSRRLGLGGAGILLGMALFPLTPLSTSLAIWMVAVVAIRVMGDTSYQILVSVHRPLYGLLGHTARLALRLPALALGFAWGEWVGVVIGLVLIEVAVAAGGWRLAKPYLRWPNQSQPPPPDWGPFCLGAGLSTLALVPFSKGPVLAMAALGGAEQVAFFGIAWQMGIVFLQANFVFCQTQLPLLRRSVEDEKRFSSLVLTQAKFTWAAYATLVGGLAMGSKPLLIFFLGRPYGAVFAHLLPVSLTVGFLATAFVFLNAQYALDRSRKVAATLAATPLLSVVFAVPAVPAFGPNAIPWCLALSCVCTLGITLYRAPRSHVQGFVGYAVWLLLIDGGTLFFLSPHPAIVGTVVFGIVHFFASTILFAPGIPRWVPTLGVPRG